MMKFVLGTRIPETPQKSVFCKSLAVALMVCAYSIAVVADVKTLGFAAKPILSASLSQEDGGSVLAKFYGGEGSLALLPDSEPWDCRSGNAIGLNLVNQTNHLLNLTVELISSDGSMVHAIDSMTPNEQRAIVLPFSDFRTVIYGEKTKFDSSAIQKVLIDAGHFNGAAKLEVDDLHCLLVAEDLPAWLGQRPPVSGEWRQTFVDHFDGASVDLSRWNIYTANHWDKRTHFSKHNVISGAGQVRLRYEQRSGYHWDDPSRGYFHYASGYLDTYGKWVQRYGYFEARMKLPVGDGLWPAFWLMPDRGIDVGPQWVRADTKDGAMEFDIMEHLSRWGPYRFTAAFHWDGYGASHKATGVPVYSAPDPEGFITVGLLWLPGVAEVYSQGKLVARYQTDRISDVQSYLIFTHVSGGWDNSELSPKQLPQDFVIDYVKVWQRQDLASQVDGVQSTLAQPYAPK